MNIKTNLKLTQFLTFDEDDGDWAIETHLETDDGFDEVSSISPCTNRFPTIKDCKDEIDDLFKVLAESYRKPKGKKKCDSSR